MVYMAGDNDLEAQALADLNELLASSLPANVRITTLVDRSPGYSSADGDWTDTRYGIVPGGGDAAWITTGLTTWGERDTGDRATLTEFINTSAADAPADRYALIVWGHGTGISGTGWDYSSDRSHLSLEDIGTAIAGSSLGRVDMVGFDTCYQGLLDQAYALRGQADYVVAAEGLIPDAGWNYVDWLSVFQQPSSPSAEQLAASAVQSLARSYEVLEGDVLTLSAVRSAGMDSLAVSWSAFTQAINAGGAGAMETLRAARANAVDFQFDTYVDLHSLMSNFVQLNDVASLDGAALNVLSSLGNVVVATSGLGAGGGLTVYMPQGTDIAYLDAAAFPLVGLAGVSDFYTAYWS
jgi:hypothetical protein